MLPAPPHDGEDPLRSAHDPSAHVAPTGHAAHDHDPLATTA
jgi:hypothetical protein